MGLCLLSQTEIKMHGTAKSSSWQEKKEREDKEREARIAQGMADSVNHIRNIEQSKLDKKLRERNFQLYDVSDWLQTGITEKTLNWNFCIVYFQIPSDGDCLYKAIAHQISLKTGQVGLNICCHLTILITHTSFYPHAATDECEGSSR